MKLLCAVAEGYLRSLGEGLRGMRRLPSCPAATCAVVGGAACMECVGVWPWGVWSLLWGGRRRDEDEERKMMKRTIIKEIKKMKLMKQIRRQKNL